MVTCCGLNNCRIELILSLLAKLDVDKCVMVSKGAKRQIFSTLVSKIYNLCKDLFCISIILHVSFATGK